MFQIEQKDIEVVLRDYRIETGIRGFSELQRYYYEQEDPNSREVRLIIKVELEDGSAVVVRFKNERDVTCELIEEQCLFAETLRQGGIVTPIQYRTNGKFAKWYCLGGYDVVVTVEEFVEGELKVVDVEIARKTGELLAKMHGISEEKGLHLQNEVLFDPFAANDLFAYDAFLTLGPSLEGEDKVLFEKIVDRYNMYMNALAPLRDRPRYAVQGDISDCNLYLDPQGKIGVFDFNRSGDNVLFCDAVMQAVFEARLMDYPENVGTDFEAVILNSFLEGYRSVREFSKEERQWFPYLCAVIRAFWSADIRWAEDGLLNAHETGDAEGVRRWLVTIWERLCV